MPAASPAKRESKVLKALGWQPGSAFRVDTPEPERDDVLLAEQLAMEWDSYATSSIDGRRCLLDLWTLGGRRYLGDHHDTPARTGLRRITINLDQNAIIASVAAQTQTVPRIRLSPQESGDLPRYCIRERAGLRLTTMMLDPNMDIGDFTPDQLAGREAITQTQYDALIAAVAPDGMPLVDAEDFWVINDDLRAEIAQYFFDQQMRDAGYEEKLSENELYSNIFGHAAQVASWDNEAQQVELVNPHTTCLRVDPNCSTIDRAEWFMLDQVITLQRAIDLSDDEQIAKQLKAAAQTGRLNKQLIQTAREGTASYAKEGGSAQWYRQNAKGAYNAMSNLYDMIQFQREMVVLRTIWTRERMPMPLSEAERGGLIALREWTMDEAIAAGLVQPVSLLAMDELGQAVPQDVLVLAETGEETAPDAANWPAPRYVYVDDYGDPTMEAADESDAQWPTSWHWRQITILPQIGRRIQSIRCPFCYPPIGWNKNIPIPQSVYGLGEPTRTEDVSWFINHLAEIISGHITYSQYREQVVPRSLHDYWRKNGIAPHSHPNKVTVLEDQTWFEFMDKGRGRFHIDAPQLDPMVVQLSQMFMAYHAQTSGHTDLLQGRTPAENPDISGRAIHQLVTQALGPIGFKARFTETMLERLSLSIVDGLFTKGWLNLRTMRNRTRKWPLGVLREFYEGGKQMRFTVQAEVVAGRGVTRDREHDQAFKEWQAGGISHLDMLERTDDPDPKATRDRVWDEQIELQQRMAQAQQPPQPAPPQTEAAPAGVALPPGSAPATPQPPLVQYPEQTAGETFSPV